MLLGSWAKDQDAQTHTLTLSRQLMSTGKHSKTACSLHNTRSSDPVSNVQRIIALSFSSDLCCWLTWNLVVRGDSMWYGRGQQSWAAALGCPHRNGPGADRPITFSLGKQKEPWNFVRKYLGKYMRQPWEWDLSLRNMNMIMDIQEPILKKCSNNAKVCVFFLSLYIKCCFDPSDFFPFLCSRGSQTVCPLRQILLCMHRRC